MKTKPLIPRPEPQMLLPRHPNQARPESMMLKYPNPEASLDPPDQGIQIRQGTKGAPPSTNAIDEGVHGGVQSSHRSSSSSQDDASGAASSRRASSSGASTRRFGGVVKQPRSWR